MLIGILFNQITWEIKQIIAELEKRQIKYKLVNNQNIYYKLSKEKDLEDNFDVFLERSLTIFRGLYSSAILETKGYKVINNFECLSLSSNKLLTTLKLLEQDIPTPKTSVAFTDESSLKAIDEEIKYPTILKPIVGSWGRLIAKLDNYNSAMSNLECRETLGDPMQKIYYLQKFISHQDNNTPTDIRVFVIGDKCVAAMGRYQPEKDFRSNLAIGGSAKPLEITPELEKLSVKALKAVKGEIAGVDIMDDDGQLNVIEVNGTPQFKGVSTATNINVAAEIVDYMINKYQ